MKKQILAMLACLVLLLAVLPVGLAPRAQAAAISADQTLEQRRQAAFDYMMSMATVMWRATEDITYTYGTSTAPIVAGRLYRGIPYTHARGDLATFMDFAGEPDEKGVVEMPGLKTEHLDGSGRHARIGNDCSGAVNAAYGSIGAAVNICGASTTVPDNGYLRVGYDKYVVKPSDSTNTDAKDVCTANGEQVMYSIYAEAQLADIWACNGHDMMNHYVTVVYNEDGTIDGEQSTATIVHQTPAPIRNESYYTTGAYSEANYGEKVYKTYEIDITRTFKWLYDNGYVPVTCKEFVDVNAVPADVTLTDTVSDYNFATITEGVLTSNRMIDSVTLTITDADGAVLQQATSYSNRYTEETTNLPLAFDLYQFEYENPEKMQGFVNLNQLGVGNYHCTTTARLRTGEILTARDFDFAVTEDDLCEGWVDNSNLTSTEGQCPVCKEVVTWQPLPQLTANTSLEVGHYYLENDVENTGYYNFKGGKFCIHLNGHNINSSTMAIRLGSATVNILGNGKVTGSYSDASSKYGSTIYLQSATAKLHLYGGQYGHNADTTQATIGMNLKAAYVAMYGGATICRMNGATGPQVYVAKGTFEMFGGLITDGDNRKNYGGNIKVGDDNGETANFIMHDGIIAYGRAKHGGNIHLDGATTSFVQHGGLIYLGMAGYITKDGAGGNLYMDLGGTAQLDGTVIYGKAYANGGNVYAKSATISVGGTVEKGNGDYGSAGGKFAGNIWIGNNTQLTITGTVRNPLGNHAYGGNISASGSDIFIDGGTVSGGTSTSRGGNIYMTATGSSLTIKNGGKLLDGSSANGGNFATNGTDAQLILEDGIISGGTATGTGPNIRLLSGATVLAQGGKIDGGLQLNTGKLELSGNAEVSGAVFTTGKLTVQGDWTGTASAKWNTAYAVGDTLTDTNGASTGAYTGKLTVLDTENRITATQDGKLYVAGPEYSIVFQNDDGTVISEGNYFAGDTVVVPEAPTKAADENYTYEFAGWTPEVAATVTGNATYTATYTATEIPKYTVKFVDENGDLISEATYVAGAEVVVPEAPTKEADETYTYEFAGWTPEVAATVTGEATYTATYNATYIEYTIVFANEGTVISTATYHYGDTVVVPEDPTKEADENYTYTFTGWNPEVTIVTGDETYSATYLATEIEVPVTNAITKHPEAATTDSGNEVQFSVVAEGEIVKYQWQYRKVYKWFNTSMTGYNTDTLTVAATGQRNGYDYRCMVTFADGTVLYSEPAELTVKTYMNITYHPNDQVVVLGYKGQFTAAAEGEGIKYQWQYQRPGSELWIDTAMEGATKATVMIETTTARNGYKYRYRITDVTGNKSFTEAATMYVLSFTSHPEEAFASVGASVQFSVQASVSEGYTYEWQYRKSETANWSNTTMTGYNTDTLTVSATLARNGYQYRCVLTGSKNSKIESKAAVLHVGDPVVFTAQPADVTCAVGEVATFTVEADNAYAYQWQFYNPINAVWKNTSAEGNTTATVNVTVKTNNNNYQYRCVVYGLDGIEYVSDAATLTLG